MVVVSGYVTDLSKEYEVTELKCIWQDATTQMISPPHGYVQYTAIHHLILCGTDTSCVKPKIPTANVNWAPHVEASKASTCYTDYNLKKNTNPTTKKKTHPKTTKLRNNKWDFHIHQQCKESLSERKEAQDRGSENTKEHKLPNCFPSSAEASTELGRLPPRMQHITTVPQALKFHEHLEYLILQKHT